MDGIECTCFNTIPNPKATKGTTTFPENKLCAKAQDVHLHNTFLGEFLKEPLHRNHSNQRILLFHFKSKDFATSAITSLPPTGQFKPSRLPCFSPCSTVASAKARHPANPQPPQLAAGSTSSTSSILGSSITLNFCATKYKITAAASQLPQAMLLHILLHHSQY